MRLALVDLLFSWPPHGGGDVDVYHVAKGLQTLGHEVHLFGVHTPGTWERGIFESSRLPFPATCLEIPNAAFTKRALPPRIRDHVDAWGPDAVLVCDGFLLKPYIIEALAYYPIAARYYAHEAACHRDILRFKDGAPCPNAYLTTPELCRDCALAYLGPDIKRGHHLAWLQEYLAAGAYLPQYHDRLRRSLEQLDAAIVYNDEMKKELGGYCTCVFTLPGGVDLSRFPYSPPSLTRDGDRRVIFMAGRGEDPVKGAAVLREAGERLAQRRTDFEIRVTMPEDTPATPWYRPIGWADHETIASLYAEADICVVPSIWSEPFGLVALEAMAVGRPVCASRVGGLQHIVRDGETGFLFDRADGAGLAECLARLLDDSGLRLRMGEAGRRRVETMYAWDRVITEYYPPILERLSAASQERKPISGDLKS